MLARLVPRHAVRILARVVPRHCIALGVYVVKMLARVVPVVQSFHKCGTKFIAIKLLALLQWPWSW